MCALQQASSQARLDSLALFPFESDMLEIPIQQLASEQLSVASHLHDKALVMQSYSLPTKPDRMLGLRQAQHCA